MVGRTEDVAEDFARPLGVVLGAVEQGLVVAGPFDAVDALGEHRRHFAGAEVLHEQLVLAIAVVVDAVREQLGVVRDREGVDGHEFLALGQLVDVEQDLFRRLEAPLLPRVDRILLPFHRARVIEVRALAIRHLDVGLLDPAQHLVIELLLQLRGGLHHLVGVGVLGLEVGDGLGALLVAEPAVFIDAVLSMKSQGLRDFLGHRRLHRFGNRVQGQHAHDEKREDGFLHRGYLQCACE